MGVFLLNSCIFQRENEAEKITGRRASGGFVSGRINDRDRHGTRSGETRNGPRFSDRGLNEIFDP